MANKNIFASASSMKARIYKSAPPTDAVNNAGGKAYSFNAKHELAQFAATGCLNDTFYTTAESQLKRIVELCNELDPKYIAKVAVYARQEGFMKDMPALLVAYLASKDQAILARIFDRVIDNTKMLSVFTQIVRSNAMGFKSLNRASRNLIAGFLDAKNDDYVFKGSVGNTPSLADIIKLAHPKPKTKSREALYGYLLGREYNKNNLPALVCQYEAFKADNTSEMPDVPFLMLTALSLTEKHWAEIAENASWQMTRMNLNTFARHNVFSNARVTKLVADRLRNEGEIEKARVFPYQLMVAFKTATDVPHDIREALQDAMEVATSKIPKVAGNVYVFPDVSGSMRSAAVTGNRGSATSAVHCVDVAALVAASFARINRQTRIIPFDTRVLPFDFNPRDSVMTNASKLSKIGGGATSCSAPMKQINGEKADVDLVIYVSDNESWVDSTRNHRCSATLAEWNLVKARNPKAKMVCIDLAPNGTTHAQEREDILNIGGFSDSVFDVIADFAGGNKKKADNWVEVIEKIVI